MGAVVTIESAADRALALRMRGDLVCRRQTFRGRDYWAVKDPVSLAYFHLREEEYAVLTMLDGQASLEDLRRACQRKFAPRSVSHQQLHGFLATLHRYGLLLADSEGQDVELQERFVDRQRRRRYETLASVLAIRFRGFNPHGILEWLYPKCRFLFSPVCAAAALTLAVAAVLLVVVQFDAFRERLPAMHAILGAANLPWLIVALAAIKVLHELGHGLACRHFGGDCHEMGVMLLVFTPCLYCNVSDTWMLPSKWQRIAVVAAGIYVELILAALCTFVWWFSVPGLLNSLALNTVLICSVGTVLFNGNPLLRYDGYFILSDLVEVPNLRAQSVAAAQRVAARWCLGIEMNEDRAAPAGSQALLAIYAIVSTAYRWLVVVAVLWALTLIAREYHLQMLVAPLAVVTFAGLLFPAAASIVRWSRNPVARRRVAATRAAATTLALAGALLLVALVPVPTRVAAPLVVEYRDAERVYVIVAGTLASLVREGQRVHAGEKLAVLTDRKIEMDLASLAVERDRQRLRLKNLEAQRLQGVADGSQIPGARALLADIEERLDQLRQDAELLTLTAPCDGTVLPPPSVLPQPKGDMLDRWSGTPLDERNQGSYLETGTLFCLIGDPATFEAAVHVEQTEIEQVAAGQAVRMTIDSLPGKVYWGTVEEIAKIDLKVMPRELEAAGDVPTRTDERGQAHPLTTWYQVRVDFDDPPAHLVARVHGQAKIVVPSQSLGWRLVRYLRQTFSR